jgi:glycosyltransferase involved in cell wall biosynthesis
VTDAVVEISVVVATRNRARLLDSLLESLAAQTLPTDRFEVVVVDDASTRDTAEVLARHLGAGRLALRGLRADRPAGPAAARNLGWHAARAALIAFTDDDCVAEPGWLAAMLRAAQARPGAILQGIVEADLEPGRRYTPFSHIVTSHECGPWYGAGNIVYPRHLLERLDGFDAEAFGGYGGSDTDLAWRAIESGADTALAPDAVVRHAVMELGPIGRIARTARAANTVAVFARHRAARRHLFLRVFFTRRHAELVAALAAAVLPRRFWLVRVALALPYTRRVVVRRSGPLLAPYIVLHDLIEMAAVIRGAVRHRTLVL